MQLHHIYDNFYLHKDGYVLRSFLYWDVKQCWLVVTNIWDSLSITPPMVKNDCLTGEAGTNEFSQNGN